MSANVSVSVVAGDGGTPARFDIKLWAHSQTGEPMASLEIRDTPLTILGPRGAVAMFIDQLFEAWVAAVNDDLARALELEGAVDRYVESEARAYGEEREP